MNDFVVRKSVLLHATPAEVWDALTNPEKTKKFFFHCEVFSTWKAGADITFKGRAFFFFPILLKGKIVAAESPTLLKYTLINGKTGSTSTVTDTITVENGVTRLSVADDVGKGEGAEKRYARSIKGWDKIFAGLKKVVEQA